MAFQPSMHRLQLASVSSSPAVVWHCFRTGSQIFPEGSLPFPHLQFSLYSLFFFFLQLPPF